MFGSSDTNMISSTNCVARLRPRGILSGFLAVVPSLGYAVYLPPVAAKMRPIQIRMRLSKAVLERGVIFSAYLTRARTIVVEDVLMWNGASVWHTLPLTERWNKLMKTFIETEWTHDSYIQGIKIELAAYLPLSAITEPDSSQVVEFVPDCKNMRRLIWIPPREEQQAVAAMPTDSTVGHSVKKELGMGPDVYAVYRGAERLGIALVRTLATSRALRSATAVAEQARVDAVHNKQFDKWEILLVHPNA